MSNISMRQLLEAGVHFGHNKRFWNPAMAEYIFGERQKIHIINLEKTLPLMRQAVEFVSGVAASRGRILFVGTKFAAREVLGEQARRCGMPYVDYRWLGGMLTNYKTIRQSVRRLKDLEAIAETKQYASFTKKEVLTLEREKTKLAASLSGIKDMGGLPDALFVIDAKEEHIAIREANRLGIPVVAVVDTNTDPQGVDFVIPGNDDAIRSIQFYCSVMADAIIAARAPILEQEALQAAKRQAVIAKRSVKKTADADVASSAADQKSSDASEPKVKTVKTVKTVKAKPEAETASEKTAAKAKAKTKAKAKIKAKAKAKVKAKSEPETKSDAESSEKDTKPEDDSAAT